MSQEPSSQNNDNNKEDRERTFEKFKLEYVQAAQRYENIYKAIWQIFQYMALLAAGILTFGSKSDLFSPEQIEGFALTPLIFWLLAIYIPMNQNGKKTKQRLVSIQQKINNENYRSIELFTNSDSDQPIPQKPEWLFNYLRSLKTWLVKLLQQWNLLDFLQSLKACLADWLTWLFSKWSVTLAIVLSGMMIFIFWLFILYKAVVHDANVTSQSSTGEIKLELKSVELNLSKTQIQEFKQSLDSLTTKLDSLTTKIDSLESLIKETTVNNPQQPNQ